MITSGQAIDRVVDAVRTLPPAPRIVADLLPLLSDANHDASKVVALIEHDPALTARVLRLCNSAALGGSSHVDDLGTALLRLGFDLVFQLVASVVANRTLGAPQRGYGMAQGELWRHAVATAISAKTIAGSLGTPPSLTFTAGLLHDLGKLVLSVSLEASYNDVLREMDQSGKSFLEAEKSVLGVDHAEVGAHLLTRWNFPDHLVQAVRHHHQPQQAAPHHVLAAAVHLGDVVAHILGHSYGHHAYAVRPCPECLQILELSPSELDQVVLAAQTQIAASSILGPEVQS